MRCSGRPSVWCGELGGERGAGFGDVGLLLAESAGDVGDDAEVGVCIEVGGFEWLVGHPDDSDGVGCCVSFAHDSVAESDVWDDVVVEAVLFVSEDRCELG